ncbi:hypothetical protein PISMIDRAFT_436470 [Pisolithus microcarpus 441]|uniref:Heterokaryon incompatibility domain-containing protein n=1 Tax=Pisolithus microcarpus 441 TaxID=765257 RepID=A0A0C9Z3P1_9AGAM|nr:hypothetical protein PISMIDRAFT_436470 [Pisolithus microcarpus 441]
MEGSSRSWTDGIRMYVHPHRRAADHDRLFNLRFTIRRKLGDGGVHMCDSHTEYSEGIAEMHLEPCYVCSLYTVSSVIFMSKYHNCRAYVLPCINNDRAVRNLSAHATRFRDQAAGRAPAEFGIPRNSVDHVPRSAFVSHPRKTCNQQPASVLCFPFVLAHHVREYFMKLLHVETVLGREADVQQADAEREILKQLDDKTTSYAILSHRWGVEVGYKEMTGLMKMEERKRDEVRQRAGYQKIIKSCEQAKKDGYVWLWVDTCCIDKRSSAELSEAINSMYRWYQNAQVCYAYLSDVSESTFPTKKDDNKFADSNGWPEWFVRGWTLQELIAPKEVQFFNKDWVHIGNKQQLASKLVNTTGVPSRVLRPEERSGREGSQCRRNHVLGCQPGDDTRGRPSVFIDGLVWSVHADAVRRREESVSEAAIGNHPHVQRSEYIRMESTDSADGQCPGRGPERLLELWFHREGGTRRICQQTDGVHRTEETRQSLVYLA